MMTKMIDAKHKVTFECSNCKRLLDCSKARIFKTFVHCENCDTYYNLQFLGFKDLEDLFNAAFYLWEVSKQEVFEKLLENNDNVDDSFDYILIESGRKEETENG